MPLSLEVVGSDKEALVTSLAAILLADVSAEVTAENISSVVSASGNKVAAYYPDIFVNVIEKAGGVDKFFQKPGGGGGSAAPAASAGGAAPAPAAAPAKPKEEEVDALDGG
jgi:large subunit ribosomal protein LP1